MDKKIKSEINKILESYKTDTVEITDGLNYSQYQTIKTIEYYFNSKYLNGQKDKLGREKPFYNINKAKVKVATRATDFDTKDVTITSDEPHNPYVALVASHELYQWAKRTRFSKTLNKMGETRAKYGGVIVKKVTKEKDVTIEVPEWVNLVTDQVDIKKGAVIETHYINAVELADKLPNWNMDVSFSECLAKAEKTLGIKRGSLTTVNSFPVFEVHGVFPKSFITGNEEDSETFSNQFYMILGVGENNQVVLHAEEEKELPYKYLGWNDVPGRALGVGVVEDGFESQIWTNDLVLKQRSIVEYASKVLFKSANPSIGSNLTAYKENGDVIDISEGDVALLNTTSSSVPMFDTLMKQWETQYEKVSSTFASNTGGDLPSGTPFRQTLILNQEANSEFDYRREEMGIFIEEIITDWVLPDLMTKINKDHILTSTYSPAEIKLINQGIVTDKANKKFSKMLVEASIEDIKKGKVATQEQYDSFVKDMSTQLITSPFLDIKKGDFDNFKPKVSVITTGENRNKAVQLESLFSILQTVAKIPQVLQDPALSQIFTRLVEVADVGISAQTLVQDVTQANAQQPTQPIQGTEALPQIPSGEPTPIA